MAEAIDYRTMELFQNYLFTKGYLVNWECEDRKDCVRTLYTLGNVFGMKITRNPQLAVWRMVNTAKQMIGATVPSPFYTGFPQSVLKLTEEQLLIDQLIHYAITYGLGDFSQPGYSLLEEKFERLAFKEKTEIKEFEIVETDEALELVKNYVSAMLTSSRALNKDMEEMVTCVAKLFPDAITVCNCKDTAIRLLYETRFIRYARFLQLPDVIRLADEINCQTDLESPAVRKAERKYNEEMAEYNRLLSVYAEYVKAQKQYEQDKQKYAIDEQEYIKELNQAIQDRNKRNASLGGRILNLFTSGKEDPITKLKPPVCPDPPEPVPQPVRPEQPYKLTRKQANKNKDARTLNLRNSDRKLIASVIDFFFEQDHPNVRDCYEKRQLWAGLLHHIHYQPKNEAAVAFVQAMRGKGENKSVYSAFEAAMAEGNVKKAVDVLAEGKGSGAVGRNLNYLLSRAKDVSDVDAVVSHLDNLNLILLIQMIQQYKHYRTEKRAFKFVQHHLLTTHKETEEEAKARRSILPESVRNMLETYLKALLEKKLAEKSIGKVYVEDGMERISLPLQEASGTSGIGILPRGSRLSIAEGSKLRCFTYWENVDDIDLACFGLEDKGVEQYEFSWRSMWEQQDECITFSGDETSGYDGGSEYFDIVLPKFREIFPNLRYLVFTDNVYTGIDFDKVLCTAGYMIREEEDSGEVFEPKTVKSSFKITGASTFAVMFALDLQRREIIWLNMTLNSDDEVAGDNDIVMIRDYLDAVDTINIASFFKGMATEIVDSPETADVIVADHYSDKLREGQKLIRSRDYELVLEYLNGHKPRPDSAVEKVKN